METEKSILILGGYGRTGMETARQLLMNCRCNIGLAGRDPARAARAARVLTWEHPGRSVRGVHVNAALKKQLAGSLAGYDLLIVAIPSTAFGEQIARTALEAGVDLLDLSSRGKAQRSLVEMNGQVREAGLTFITGADLVNGVPYVMKRYLAGHFDFVDKMTVTGPILHRRSPLTSLLRTMGLGRDRRGTAARAGFVGRTPETPGRLPLPFWVAVTAWGGSGGARGCMSLVLEHRNPPRAAAAAALPCALGILDGSLGGAGVDVMGHAVDPDRYLETLWESGMTVSLEGLSDLNRKQSPVCDPGLFGQVA